VNCHTGMRGASLPAHLAGSASQDTSRGEIRRMIKEEIERLAAWLLEYKEDDLNQLLNHYKTKMEEGGEPSVEWERAVIAYFMINGVRVKNTLKQGKVVKRLRPPTHRPPLHCIK
jgi:hypothetical protein